MVPWAPNDTAGFARRSFIINNSLTIANFGAGHIWLGWSYPSARADTAILTIANFVKWYETFLLSLTCFIRNKNPSQKFFCRSSRHPIYVCILMEDTITFSCINQIYNFCLKHFRNF